MMNRTRAAQLGTFNLVWWRAFPNDELRGQAQSWIHRLHIRTGLYYRCLPTG